MHVFDINLKREFMFQHFPITGGFKQEESISG